MADTNGAVDLRQFLTREDHAGPFAHEMGSVLPYADLVTPTAPRGGKIGSSTRVAAADHVHPATACHIRNDSVPGGTDAQFVPGQIGPGNILQGTMLGTTAPDGVSTKRWLAIRFGDGWYGVYLTLDTVRANNTGSPPNWALPPESFF